ncbi:hypothetical protein A0J61_10586 [Choanephora cucurbitarum]|uniref:Uncharacterized protein n=1 Tax=Choanephora cucurbitarum TaxID=101091 RepID=A0A1C7MWV2_9FUNG|nr:hypothetical protein A0J61_10586 [Choanephora cucurbitarum]
MPGSRRKMNKGQAQEDTTLRNLQYLISGVFRPLDILGSEICTTNLPMEETQRFITILADVRTLLLNVNSTISSSRLDINFRAVNPTFKAATNGTHNYLMSPDGFAEAVSQQSAVQKTMRKASSFAQRNRRRNNSSGPSNFNSGNNNTGAASNNPFFRAGPPMGRGGFSNNTRSHGQRNGNRSHGIQHKANTNPFIKNNRQ